MDSSDFKQRLTERFGPSQLAEAGPGLAWLPPVFERFSESEWYLVGGAVRDILIGGRSIKDYDFVVRQIGLDELTAALREYGDVNLVGRDFGVLKFRPKGLAAGEEIDIAWPRTERAGMTGGYRDFEVQSDPALPVTKDLARRDFTMNAMAWDIRRQELVDPHGGLSDVGKRLVRAVGDPETRFKEDLSRMLRAVRQACQLGFEVEPRTWEAIKHLSPHINDERPLPKSEGEDRVEMVVPRETVAKELGKTLAADPPRAVELLEVSGLLFWLMPELAAMGNCPQSPNGHAEGNVWEHAKMTVAALSSPDFYKFFSGEQPATETLFAALLHDIGKPASRQVVDGLAVFEGHTELGASLTRTIARRLRLSSIPGGFSEDRLVWLVRHHQFPNMFDPDEVKRSVLERFFFSDRQTGRALLHLAWADVNGRKRHKVKLDMSNLKRLLAVLKEMEEKLLATEGQALLGGEEVMQLGEMSAGPAVGQVLADLREAQLNGEVESADQAREFVKKYLS